MNLRARTKGEIDRRRAHDPNYQAAELRLAVTEAIESRMAEQQISKADLARHLKVRPTQITKLLNAEKCNLTLKTLARLAVALNARLEWDFRPILEEEGWRASTQAWACPPEEVTLTPPAAAEERTNAIPLAA